MTTPITGSLEPDPIFPLTLGESGETTPSAPSGGPTDTLSISSNSSPMLSLSLETILPQPKVGLLSFLSLLSAMSLEHKKASGDTQAEILAINREFFLGLSIDFVNIVELRKSVTKYYNDRDRLIEKQNDAIDDLNSAISHYNNDVAEANGQIADLNQAIAAFNQADPGDPGYNAALNAFNHAVDDFNDYVQSSGNPALSEYQTAVEDYQNEIADISDDIDDFNEKVVALNEKNELNLALLTLNAPSAPSGIASLPSYSQVGSPPNVQHYPISSIASLQTLDTIPIPERNVEADVGAAIVAQLAAIALLQKTFQNISDYNAFVAFVLRSGTSLSPAAITAFIENSQKPTLDGAGGSNGQGGSVNLGSSVLGLNSPLLEGQISNSIYGAAVQKFDQTVAQNFIDQLNLLNTQVLLTAGQKSGFSTLNAVSNEEPIPENADALNAAVTALFAEELLEIIQNSGEALKPAIEQLAKETLKVPPEELDALVNTIAAAQSFSLALNGALAIGLAINDTAFVGNLVNSIPNISTVTSQLPFQPLPTVFEALNDSANQLLLKATLNQELQDTTTLNQTINQTIAQTTQNTTAEEFRAALEKNLLAANLSPLQASKLSDQALGFVQSLTTARNPTPPTSTSDLATSVTNQLSEILSPLGSDIANQIAARVGLTIFDQLNPNNTITKLIQEYVESQSKLSDQAREEVVRELLGFVPPTELQVIKPSILLLQLLDPAYNITKSFMTGLMYDKKVPANLKAPTDIRI